MLSLTKPQVVPLSWVLSQMRLPSPAPHFWGTAALTHWRVSPSHGRVPAPPRKVCGTVLLLTPRDCSQMPAHTRKSSRDSVAAAFQGLWKITAHIWHQASPLMTLFSTSECDHCLGSAGPRWPHSLYQVSFQQWNRFSLCGPRTSRAPLCSWGFALPTRAPPGIGDARNWGRLWDTHTHCQSLSCLTSVFTAPSLWAPLCHQGSWKVRAPPKADNSLFGDTHKLVIGFGN